MVNPESLLAKTNKTIINAIYRFPGVCAHLYL